MTEETKKHAGGRPSELTEEIVRKAEEYVKQFEGVTTDLPQVAQLAYVLDVSRKTLYNWAEKDEEFLHILEKLLSLQEFALIKLGLKGEYNSTIAKLILAKHGYRDSSETDVTSGGKPIPILGGITTQKNDK